MPGMFIFNPYANRWKAGRRKDEAMAALRAAGVDVELRLTEYPGHGSPGYGRALMKRRAMAAGAAALGMAAVIEAALDRRPTHTGVTRHVDAADYQLAVTERGARPTPQTPAVVVVVGAGIVRPPGPRSPNVLPPGRR
jgi:hypothetical protein